MAKKYQKFREKKPMQTGDVVPLGGYGYQQNQNTGVEGIEAEAGPGQNDSPNTPRPPAHKYKIKVQKHLEHPQLKWGW